MEDFSMYPRFKREGQLIREARWLHEPCVRVAAKPGPTAAPREPCPQSILVQEPAPLCQWGCPLSPCRSFVPELWTSPAYGC